MSQYLPMMRGKVWAVLLAVAIGGSVNSSWADDALAYSGVGALAGAVVGGLTAPHHNRHGHALIGAGLGGLAGYVIGNERDKEEQPRYTRADYSRSSSYRYRDRPRHHHPHSREVVVYRRYPSAPVYEVVQPYGYRSAPVVQVVPPGSVLVPVTPMTNYYGRDEYYYR